MRIISPIDCLNEAAALLEAGADELYGGYLPPAWRDDFDLLTSLNQCTFPQAQIANEAELAEIIARVHDHGRSFVLTLNAPFFSDAQLPRLLDYLDRMTTLGIDGLLLADAGLFRLLIGRYPRLEFHAGTMAHISNSGALRFFASLGVRRAVLPHHLTVAEMAAIANAVPEVRCAALLLVGKCPNTEGLCTFHHVSPERIWPCEIPPLRGAIPSPQLAAAMVRQGSWAQSDRRHGCGLCAIPLLLNSGLAGFKLLGRGVPMAQKVRNILLVREFLELARTEPDFDAYRRRAMIAHHKRFGAECHSDICYYSKLLPDS